MNKPKLISFDLQGTLSESAFSDEFWLELLPSLYAKKHQVNIDEVKDRFIKEYQSIGLYHEFFYDHRIRLNEVLSDWDFLKVINQLNNKPALDYEVLSLVKKIHGQVPIIILSATTRDFIDIELGEASYYFKEVFSTIDDFRTPGKPCGLYLYVAQLMNVRPEECFHIGDCWEMDIINAQKAGWSSFYLNKRQNKKERLADLHQILSQFYPESIRVC